MEETYDDYLKREGEIAKPKFTNNQFIIGGLIILVLILGVYIYSENSQTDIELARNESYALGFNQGVEQWNSAVIYEVNNNGVIPYWFNGSYYELPITQGVQND